MGDALKAIPTPRRIELGRSEDNSHTEKIHTTTTPKCSPAYAGFGEIQL